MSRTGRQEQDRFSIPFLFVGIKCLYDTDSDYGKWQNDRMLPINHRPWAADATGRTTSTEHGARRTTFSATLPKSTYMRPVRPCVPITMRSTWWALAVSTIS